MSANDHKTQINRVPSTFCLELEEQEEPMCRSTVNKYPPQFDLLFDHQKSFSANDVQSYKFKEILFEAIEGKKHKTSTFDVDSLDSMVDTTFMTLYPRNIIALEKIRFKDIIYTLFHSPKAQKLPFTNKVYNALQISEKYPEYYKIIGIQWKTNNTFKINKPIFLKFLHLNLRKDSKTDLFTCNGFKEAPSELISEEETIMQHISPGFHNKSSEKELKNCNNLKLAHSECKNYL